MSRILIFSQFQCPDDAPTSIYAEMTAEATNRAGAEVILVTGRDSYRQSSRPAPDVRTEVLDHYSGNRESLPRTLRGYCSLSAAMAGFIRKEVAPGDTVLMLTAPPTTLRLHQVIRQRGARSIYRLDDYYPELLRGLWNYPRPARWLLSKYWDRELACWDCVVKTATNLGYEGTNARVIRNWPTLDLGPPRPAKSATALYAGNLGYAHDVGLLVEACRELRTRGYRILLHADGPGVSQLPDWLQPLPMIQSNEKLIQAYWDAEIHLIAARPDITKAIFPSKFWNSHLSGRTLRATGFAGAMQKELEHSLRADSSQHLKDWVELLIDPEAHLSS